MRDLDNVVFDIPSSEEEKDLGVVFENSLKFNKHVLNVVNRCKKTQLVLLNSLLDLWANNFHSII